MLDAVATPPFAASATLTLPPDATLTTSVSAALFDAAFAESPEYLPTIACVHAASELVEHVARALAIVTAEQPESVVPSAVN